MLGRIIVIAMIVAAPLSLVALVALILVRPPPAVERSGAADTARSSEVVRIPFSGRTDGWSVTAVAFADRSGAVEVDLRIAGADGRPAPDDLRLQGFLIMLGHSMPPEILLVERMTPGAYRVRGQAGMSGSWRLRLVLPDGQVEAGIQVAGR